MISARGLKIVSIAIMRGLRVDCHIKRALAQALNSNWAATLILDLTSDVDRFFSEFKSKKTGPDGDFLQLRAQGNEEVM